MAFSPSLYFCMLAAAHGVAMRPRFRCAVCHLCTYHEFVSLSLSSQIVPLSIVTLTW